MPSLHCKLPPDEEEPKPHQEEQENAEEMNENNESEDLEMDENADTAQSEASNEASNEVSNEASNEAASEETSNDSDDDIGDIYDTSSEASSMLNDPTIQHFVPIVSSSDEDESKPAEFWTPTTSTVDDTCDRRMSPTTSRNYRQPGVNTARRSRPKRYGVVYARRGRHRQPVQ